MAKATKGKQLEIRADNVAGQGATLFGILRDNKIDVKASCGWTEGEQAVFLVVPDDLQKARKILRKAKYKVLTKQAVFVEMNNGVGAYAKILDKIAQAKIDCHVSYGSAGSKRGKVFLVLTTSSDARAVRAIN